MGWLVEEGDCITLLAVSVVAAGVVGEDIDDNDLEVDVKDANFETSEVEVDSIEILEIGDTKELEILFNWSSGVAWKVSLLGFWHSLSTEQRAHYSEV